MNWIAEVAALGKEYLILLTCDRREQAEAFLKAKYGSNSEIMTLAERPDTEKLSEGEHGIENSIHFVQKSLEVF